MEVREYLTFYRCTEAEVTQILLHEAPKDEQKEHATIRAGKLITITATTESPLAVMSKCDLMAVDRIQMARPTQRTLPA